MRKQMIGQLKKNIAKVLSPISEQIVISGGWDYLQISAESVSDHQQALIIEKLTNTSGIDFILQVQIDRFDTLEQISQRVVEQFAEKLTGKTFCVRIKRSGKHEFSSIQAEKHIGAALLQAAGTAKVKLKQPEIQIDLEIRDNLLYRISNRFAGLGGFPLGQQGACMSLISGGFDSSVATYLMMRRGVRTHFCFFNLGGMAHEVGVKQVAHYLWEKYASSHRTLFISIPFQQVVSEIMQKIHHSLQGVVLKRMMLRIANKLTGEFHVDAIATGESIAQVSSQTMANLAVIDQISEQLVLRPLSTMHKQEIITLARQTGTEVFAARMPEYCGVISNKPTIKAKLERVEKAESNFDLQILEQAFAQRQVTNIDKIYQSIEKFADIQIVNLPKAQQVIIDIRHPNEVTMNPLQLTSNRVICIPFFNLHSTELLDKHTDYLLYCDKGVMSQLQAEELIAKGYRVKVYQP